MRAEFEERISGFADTLLMARYALPGERSYKQVDLVRVYLGKGYDAHNALADVQALQTQFDKLGGPGRRRSLPMKTQNF